MDRLKNNINISLGLGLYMYDTQVKTEVKAEVAMCQQLMHCAGPIVGLNQLNT